MAVEIKMTGICEYCACADLELSHSACYENNMMATGRWDIRCTKESACKRILMMEKSRLSDSLNNDTTVVSYDSEGVKNE